MEDVKKLEFERERERKITIKIFKVFGKGELCVFDQIAEEFVWFDYELVNPKFTMTQSPNGLGFIRYIFCDLHMKSYVIETINAEFIVKPYEVCNEIEKKFEKFKCVLTINDIYVNDKRIH